MKNPLTTSTVVASFAFLLVLATVADAQAFRTWVAGDGNDANPCTYALPCQSFAAAVVQTNAGGEINVKNAGDFGQVTIDKSITIDGGGTFAGILATGAGLSAITIDDAGSGTPNTAVVTLRNLSLNGGGVKSYGVYFAHGNTLNIENCQISNFANIGLNLALILTGGTVNIKNTSVFNSRIGVQAQTSSGSVAVSLNGCNIEQNTQAGVILALGSYASIRDSVIDFNGYGVQMAPGTTVNIVGSQINRNTTGFVLFGATSLATVGSSNVMDNTNNFSNSGTIQTFGNNETSTTNQISGLVNLSLQ